MNSPQRGSGEKGTPAQPDGTPGGALGARLVATDTFHGRDPETLAASTVCHATPTKCQARTRLYRNGQLELEGFPVADISDYITDPAVTVWLDLRDPDQDDLGVLSEGFGLHPLAVEDAAGEGSAPSSTGTAPTCSDRLRGKLDTGTGQLAPAKSTPSSPTGR